MQPDLIFGPAPLSQMDVSAAFAAGLFSTWTSVNKGASRNSQDGGGGGPSDIDSHSFALPILHEDSGGVGSNCKLSSRKPYGINCPLCNKWSSSNADLKKHLRSHTGERPFKCHLCTYSATVKCNLRRHLYTVHKLNDVVGDAV